MESEEFRDLANCFGDLSMTQPEIGEAGIQLMVKG